MTAAEMLRKMGRVRPAYLDGVDLSRAQADALIALCEAHDAVHHYRMPPFPAIGSYAELLGERERKYAAFEASLEETR